jgi:hypothetical protein
MLLDRGCTKRFLMFIFGGLRLLGLFLFLHAQDIIRNGNLSYLVGYHLSRIIIISRGLLIIVNCSRFLIWLHIVIGNLLCVLTDSDNPFTIKEEVLVYLSLGVLLGEMLDVTLPALLLDLIHLHTFNE